MAEVSAGNGTQAGGKSCDTDNNDRSLSQLAKPIQVAAGQTDTVDEKHSHIGQSNSKVFGSVTVDHGKSLEMTSATTASQANKNRKEPSHRGQELGIRNSLDNSVTSALEPQETRAHARPSKFSLQATPFVPAEQRQASSYQAGAAEHVAKSINPSSHNPGMITQVSAVCSNGQFGPFAPGGDLINYNYYPMATNNFYAQTYMPMPLQLQNAMLCPTTLINMPTHSGVYYDANVNVTALFATAPASVNYPFAGADNVADTGYYGVGLNAPICDDASQVCPDVNGRSGSKRYTNRNVPSDSNCQDQPTMPRGAQLPTCDAPTSSQRSNQPPSLGITRNGELHGPNPDPSWYYHSRAIEAAPAQTWSRSRNRPPPKSAPRYAKEASTSNNRRLETPQPVKRDVQAASAPIPKPATGEVVRGIIRLDQSQVAKLSGVEVRSNATQFTWSSESDFPALSNAAPNAASITLPVTTPSTVKPAPVSTAAAPSSTVAVAVAVRQNVVQQTEVEIKPSVRWSSVAKSPANNESQPAAAQNATKPQSRQRVANQPASASKSSVADQKVNDRESSRGKPPTKTESVTAGSIPPEEKENNVKQRADSIDSDGKNDAHAVDTQSYAAALKRRARSPTKPPQLSESESREVPDHSDGIGKQGQHSSERTPECAAPAGRAGSKRDQQKARNAKRNDKATQQETFKLDQEDFPQMTANVQPPPPPATVADADADADFPTLKMAVNVATDEPVRKRPSAENTGGSVWKKPSTELVALANKSLEQHDSVVKVSNSSELISTTPSKKDDAIKKTPNDQFKTGKMLKKESSVKKTPREAKVGGVPTAQSSASATKVTESLESPDSSKKKKNKLKACGLQLNLASVFEKATARRDQLDAAEQVALGESASAARGKESKLHGKAPVLAYRLQKSVMNSVDKPTVKAAVSVVKLPAAAGEFSHASHPNVLDCSAPARLRGKEREKPKNKKLSLLKRHIILERIALRKQRVNRLDELAIADQPSPAQVAETKPCVNVNAALPMESSNDPLRSEALGRIHTRRFREYCDQSITRKINRQCYAVLSTLAYYQRRHMQKDPVKARMRKRVVCGLHECAKYVRAGSRTCRALVIAPNLEDTPSLNAVIRGLIATCARNQIRVLFALTRQTLGSALHRDSPVACIAILSLAGAEQTSTGLFELVDQARVSYQDRLAAEMRTIAASSVTASDVAATGPKATASKASLQRGCFVDALDAVGQFAPGDDEYEPI